MITKLSPDGWEYGNVEQPSDLLYTIPAGAIVEVGYRAPAPGILYAVTPDGELMYLAQGSEISYRGRLDGFSGLSVRAQGSYAIRATHQLSSEAVDPTVMVHQPVEVINPQKVAMREMLREYLAKAKLAGLFDTPEKAQAEFEELADDIANGDLEFEEPDPYSLTAAHEAEEARIRERHMELMEQERETRDRLAAETPPPGEPKMAPQGAVAAEGVTPGPGA